jgi:putative ABC transport system permease protein
MERLFKDVRIAVRSLLRHRAFTTVAVATLALGIGATTAIFSVVNGVLLRPLPYADSDRLLSVWGTGKADPQRPPGISWGTLSHANFTDLRREARSFESMAAYTNSGFMVTGPGEPEILDGAPVSPGFFRVFGAAPVLGREFAEEEDRLGGPRVLVISHALWRERFGGRPDVLGQTMEISGRQWEIVGVAPPGFSFPHDARLWSPIQNDESRCARDCAYLDAVARLKADVRPEQAGQELALLAARLEKEYPNANADTTVQAAPLQDIMVGAVRPAVIAIFGAVAMVLLIACANVGNLVLVRGTARQTELAVRASLGASRRRLAAELLTESLVVAVGGAALGLVVARWGVDALKALAPPNIPRLDTVGVDLAAGGFAMALALATALLFGLGPALSLAGAPIAGLLRAGGRGDSGDRRRRGQRAALLAAEVGLSVLLLTGAGLLLRSFARIQAIEPGWSSRGVTTFTVYLPAARFKELGATFATFDQIDERLTALPGVEMVGRASRVPVAGGDVVQSFRRVELPPPAPGQDPVAQFRIVDHEYLRALRIPLLRGRGIESADREGAPRVAVVSRAAAERYWPGEDPIGRQVLVANDGAPRTVVGIAGDVRSTQLTLEAGPEMYVPQAQTDRRVMAFLVRGEAPPAQVLAAARDIVHAVDPKLPLIQPRTMADIERQALARPRFYLLLVALFAVLAVVLAAVGVYGVVAYVAAQRTREIGVRMALGARTPQVVRLVVWQGARPALIGAALGLGGALAGGRLIAGLLYGVAPRDPLTLAAVVPLLLAVVLLACLIPALRASRIAPVEALRAD